VDFAVVLAEAYLDALAGATREQLAQYVGRPAEQLIMGVDQRPYLITAVAVQRPAGGLYLHVGVTTGDWDDAVPVVRSTVVSIDIHGARREG
jgi:hypothetical protein